MANSVDPDQTDLGLHCLHMLFCQLFLVYKILFSYFLKILSGKANSIDPDLTTPYAL